MKRAKGTWKATLAIGLLAQLAVAMAQTTPPVTPVTPGKSRSRTDGANHQAALRRHPYITRPGPQAATTQRCRCPPPGATTRTRKTRRRPAHRHPGLQYCGGRPPRIEGRTARLTTPFVGKARSFEDLANAAAEVTRFLQSELGYYLGYAYIPEQQTTSGVVRIAVLEGRLDEVRLNWAEGLPVRREVIQAYLDELKPGAILKVRDVERVVFLVNDLRGITAQVEVQAGSKPGNRQPGRDAPRRRHLDSPRRPGRQRLALPRQVPPDRPGHDEQPFRAR